MPFLKPIRNLRISSVRIKVNLRFVKLRLKILANAAVEKQMMSEKSSTGFIVL